MVALPDALKIVFVAGNESVYTDQDGERELAEALALAGSRDQGVANNWPDVARGGRGNFSAIDARFSQLQVATPQDAILLELNDRLNMTYVWSELRDADLPEELHGLATAELVAYVEQKRAERETIQHTIQEVSVEREAYLRAAPARGGQGTGIGDALLEAIRAQAVAAGLLPDC